MCIYGGQVCMSVPNMKFLCLTPCQGEVCTDDANDTNAENANTDDADANANDDGQSMIVEGTLVDKPNEQKIVLWSYTCQLRLFLWPILFHSFFSKKLSFLLEHTAHLNSKIFKEILNFPCFVPIFPV